MPAPIRTIESIPEIRERFETVADASFYAACLAFLEVELQKQIRNQDWVVMAIVREVAWERGLLAKFLLAYEHVEASLDVDDDDAPNTSRSSRKTLISTSRYTASLKDRSKIDRLREYVAAWEHRTGGQVTPPSPLRVPGCTQPDQVLPPRPTKRRSRRNAG